MRSEPEGGNPTIDELGSGSDRRIIGAFLDLLARDIEVGRNIEELPDGLARKMREHAHLDIDLDEPIEGDVDL